MGQREALSPAPHAVLDARDLAVTPPGATEPSVRGISLTVAPGEWVALVGENGGGKTSLLHALAGLWPISSGTLRLDGHPFGPGDRAQASAVAAVLQDPSSQILQPTVAEELAFAARNLGVPEQEVAREVGRRARDFGLEQDLSLDPATLSAGRQQQVLLAAALVARPRLLFADEPTAHLDAASRARVLDLVRTEIEAGMAVVWATQDPDETRCATRILEVGPPGRTVDPPGPHRASGAAPRPELLLRIVVTPSASDVGPRVRVARPLEIAIEGEGVTALVGANGVGKSVLLGSVAGLERPPQVSVTWSGPHEPPIMALQYPELQVFEELVADELVFAAVARGMKRSQALAEAANHLQSLGFEPESMLSKRTWTLSTGEKRLVEVVGALIAPASLVILDEPTAGLDPGRRQALAGLVVERAASGPVLVASQDTGWLAMVAGRRFQLAD
jgi:energy-coupling factor transport system ATP-binding protein